MVEIVFVVQDTIDNEIGSGKDGLHVLGRRIDTGISSDTHYEVLSGLYEGEAVVSGSYKAISRELWHKAPVQIGDGFSANKKLDCQMPDLIFLEGIKRYYSLGGETVKALDGVNVSIKANEYISIMGPSGSGKSTLMNIIGCLDTPTEGKYVLDNEPVQNMDDGQLASIRNRKIGFVFQTFNLLPKLTAIQNVELPLIYSNIPKYDRMRQAENAMEKVSLSDRIKHKPNELSGGQRQRVAIARALVTNPSIILADEPTGNLDSKSGEDIMTVLDGLNKDGNTIILVTHEAYIANHAGRTIQLLDGKIQKDFQN